MYEPCSDLAYHPTTPFPCVGIKTVERYKVYLNFKSNFPFFGRNCDRWRRIPWPAPVPSIWVLYLGPGRVPPPGPPPGSAPAPGAGDGDPAWSDQTPGSAWWAHTLYTEIITVENGKLQPSHQSINIPFSMFESFNLIKVCQRKTFKKYINKK